ncbi:MAG: hypothetical protein HOO99_01840, partial [Hyphomicrobiaceae bacterium]|nr:hypothetical protein [Hyphomicrobiaceae bacterium]
TLDRIYKVEALPGKGGKYRASDYLEVGGGLAATAAVAIARLGEAVEFVGRVGSDAAGRHIIAGLAAERVGTRGMQILPGIRSVTPAVLVDATGERAIISNTDPKLYDGPGDIASFLQEVATSRGVTADVRWLEGARAVLDVARACRLPAVLDVEKAAASAVADLAPRASHVVFSTPGLATYTGTDDVTIGLNKAFAEFGDVVAVTMGGDGVLVLSAAGLAHVVAPKVDVVDTTGAGDAFHGAYLVAIAEGQDAIEAARFANAVAALKCTRLGGRAGLPTRTEVNAFRILHG